jgi:hypothetical protein
VSSSTPMRPPGCWKRASGCSASVRRLIPCRRSESRRWKRIGFVHRADDHQD